MIDFYDVKVISAITIRPWLWRSAWNFVPNNWWKWPPSIRPPAKYIAFRMITAYGDPNYRPNINELLRILHWCRKFNQISKKDKPFIDLM